MKTNIRTGLFETNSSSMHAISVTKDKPKYFYPEYTSCEFHVSEFGWEHRTYYDFADKASYLWTAIINNFLIWIEEDEIYTGYDGKIYHKRHVELDKENPEYIKIKDAIKQALVNAGIEDDGWNIRFQEEFDSTEYGIETGYIDHSPEMDFINELVFNEDRLIRFLFNDASYIITWNDNEWYYDGEDDEEDEDENYGEEINWEDPESVSKYNKWYNNRKWKYFGGIPNNSEWHYIKGN